MPNYQFLFLLTCYVTLTWTVVYIITVNSSFSRQYRYVKTYEEFMSNLNIYKNSSHEALNSMKEWLRAHDTTRIFSDKNNKINSNKKFCVSVMSRERKGENANTVMQSVVSILARIQLKYQNEVEINIFNANEVLNQSKYLNIVSDLVDVIDLTRPYNLKVNTHWRLKEIVDYAEILMILYNKNCKYALILEDDAIASINWYEKTLEALRYLVNNHKNWLSLKLFTSYQKFEWLFNFYAVIKAILRVFLLTLIQIIAYNKLIFIRKVPIRQKLKFRSFQLIIGVIGLNTFLLYSFIINSSCLPFGVGVHRFSQGFNAVANIYANVQLKLISDYLYYNVNEFLNNGNADLETIEWIEDVPILYPKDLLLEFYRKKNSLTEYVVEPSIFQHIGFFSSLTHRNSSFFPKFQNQHFQSYSFEDNLKPILFDPIFWLQS